MYQLVKRSFQFSIEPNVALTLQAGFHLADGTLYTYRQGDEDEDIAAAWDWNF